MISNLLGRRVKNLYNEGVIVAVFQDRGEIKLIVEYEGSHQMHETDVLSVTLEPKECTSA